MLRVLELGLEFRVSGKMIDDSRATSELDVEYKVFFHFSFSYLPPNSTCYLFFSSKTLCEGNLCGTERIEPTIYVCLASLRLKRFKNHGFQYSTSFLLLEMCAAKTHALACHFYTFPALQRMKKIIATTKICVSFRHPEPQLCYVMRNNSATIKLQ